MRRCRLEECRAACCLYGVWVREEEVERIQSHAALISPHMQKFFEDPSIWFDGRTEPDELDPEKTVLHSTVRHEPDHYGGTACIFLRDDHKCALQVAGEAAGLDPWYLKPFYCILHPLDLDEKMRITLDETPTMLNEEGSCLRPAEQMIPLVETFEPELRYFLGDEKYEELRKHNLENPQ